MKAANIFRGGSSFCFCALNGVWPFGGNAVAFARRNFAAVMPIFRRAVHNMAVSHRVIVKVFVMGL